jgi:hypothetical protein
VISKPVLNTPMGVLWQENWQQVCAPGWIRFAARCAMLCACRVRFPVRWFMTALQQHPTTVPALPDPPTAAWELGPACAQQRIACCGFWLERKGWVCIL